MRKFKFLGDPNTYSWDNTPIYGCIYPGNHTGKIGSLQWRSSEIQNIKDDTKIDWQEVTEQETTRIPNQDMPASSITKFEMSVFMAMQGYISAGSTGMPTHKQIAELAIGQAQETFKQLEDENENSTR